MSDVPLSRAAITQQLLALGVTRGRVLLVHTAFSKIAPVEGGPHGPIDALRDALGPDGTLVMPSMTEDASRPFDVTSTPCPGMGVVADTFWRLPGVLRSDNPSAFAAIGPGAAAITAAHPIDPPHGPDSPVGRVHALDGHVLLLGAGHDANTTIHLAENLAGVRYRRRVHLTILENGRPVPFAYDEIDHCCAKFSLLDEWLQGRQRRGRVGAGEARLARSRDIVSVVIERLRQDETAFLHPPGHCGECDEAWASLPPSRSSP